MKFDDNPILLDTSNDSSKRKQKILCVLCKIELDCFNPSENRYRCHRCRNTYQLGFEILPQEDELESSHSNELDEGVGLLSAEDEFHDSVEEEKIKRPKYMQDSDTTKVIEYHE